MSAADVVLNSFWAATIWLGLPFVVRWVLGTHLPEAQRALGRAVFLVLPFVTLWAGAGWVATRPLIARSPENVPGRPAAGWVNELATPREVPVASRGAAVPRSPGATTVETPEPAGLRSTGGAPRFEAHVATRPPEARGQLHRFRDAPPDFPVAATPPAGEESARAALPPGVPFLALWAAVTILGVVRLGSSWLALRRLRDRWRRGPLPAQKRLRFLARTLGYRRGVRLLASPSLKEAVALGVYRPAVAVPEDWLKEFDGPQLEPLLLHEIAHLQSRDPLWRIVGWLFAAILWPHPLVHWLRRRDVILSEYVADRRALGGGANNRGYALLLSELAVSKARTSLITPLANAVLGPRSHLEGRIKMILSSSRLGSRRRRVTNVLLVSGAALALSFIVTHPLVGTCDPFRDDPHVKLELERGAEWWTVVGRAADPGAKELWTVRLCPSEDGSNGQLTLAKPHWAHVQVGETRWQIDTRTGQVQPGTYRPGVAPELAFASAALGPGLAPSPTGVFAEAPAAFACPPSESTAPRVPTAPSVVVRADKATPPFPPHRHVERERARLHLDLAEAKRNLELAHERARGGQTDLEAIERGERRIHELRAHLNQSRAELENLRMLHQKEAHEHARLRDHSPQFDRARAAYEHGFGLNDAHGRRGHRGRSPDREAQAIELLSLVVEREGRLNEDELDRLQGFLRKRRAERSDDRRGPRADVRRAPRAEARTARRRAGGVGRVAPHADAKPDPRPAGEVREMFHEIRVLREELLELRRQLQRDRERLERALEKVDGEDKPTVLAR